MTQDNSAQPTTQRRTMKLWPDAGRALGLGRQGTYEAASRGDIAGLIKIGKRFLVLREPFERFIRGQTGG